MNDDLERRLRRALQAKADTAVGENHAVPTMRVDRSSQHVRLVPILAAAALVTTVAGGSVALVAFTDHHEHSPVASETKSTGANPTATPFLAGTGSWPVPPTRPFPRPRHPTAPLPTIPARPTFTPTPPSSAPRSTATPTPTPPTARSTTAPSTHGPSVTVPPVATKPSTTAAPTPRPGTSCATAALTLAIGGDRMVGTKGGDYTILDLTNTGSSCALDGYPAIAIFDGSGTKIGGPAGHRASPAPQHLVLAHGARAEVELYDWNDSAPDCTANYGVGRTLQFTPPGQGTPITIDYGYSACQLSVTSLHPPKAHPVTD